VQWSHHRFLLHLSRKGLSAVSVVGVDCCSLDAGVSCFFSRFPVGHYENLSCWLRISCFQVVSWYSRIISCRSVDVSKQVESAKNVRSTLLNLEWVSIFISLDKGNYTKNAAR
jgi:hypothetical protein